MPFVMEIIVEETRVCVNGRRRRMKRWRRIHDDSGKAYTFNKSEAAKLVLKFLCGDTTSPDKARVVEIERVNNAWLKLRSVSK